MDEIIVEIIKKTAARFSRSSIDWIEKAKPDNPRIPPKSITNKSIALLITFVTKFNTYPDIGSSKSIF